jgi:MFS family permease
MHRTATADARWVAISSLGAPWQLYLGHGLFIGFLGNGGINAPLYVYVSRWFDRRRGSALALISSGAYLAGAVWPPIFERVIAVLGWRQTMWCRISVRPLKARFPTSTLKRVRP